jgi:ribonuclease P protein component
VPVSTAFVSACVRVPAAPSWRTAGARAAPSCLPEPLLTAVHRMRNREDFSTTVRHGAKAGRTRLVVHLLPDTSRHSGPSAVGFVVSRSVGSAVVRNRVKRQLRHLMRGYVDRLPDGCRVVVRALPASAGSPAASLDADLEAALRRAGGW